ncbi:MAG: hypothetical protein IT576_14475 [Verrucomicrobiales bacterium]|nr:hypothetical protein [Verrucomicrobiales bacterium]
MHPHTERQGTPLLIDRLELPLQTSPGPQDPQGVRQGESFPGILPFLDGRPDRRLPLLFLPVQGCELGFHGGHFCLGQG